MEYLTLKNSDLRVSRLCMGGCPMGRHGWGAVDEQELIDAVHAALDRGINFFDNADTYGLGQSETTLGKALRGRRQEAVIATKFGVRVEDGHTFYDNRPDWIREACENSLRRLGTDCIDLYQVHYRDGRTPVDEVLGMLELLRQQGKVRFFGLSNLTGKDLPQFAGLAGSFSTLQNQYSLACRDAEADIRLLAEKLAVTPMTWGSLGQGVLTGKYGADAVFGANDRRSREIYVNFHGEKLLKNLKIVEELRSVAAAHGQPVSAAAVRFILDYLPGSVVLVGAKRPAQILENARAMGWNLNERELRCLDEVSNGGSQNESD